MFSQHPQSFDVMRTHHELLVRDADRFGHLVAELPRRRTRRSRQRTALRRATPELCRPAAV